jgi:hypothetical protein
MASPLSIPSLPPVLAPAPVIPFRLPATMLSGLLMLLATGLLAPVESAGQDVSAAPAYGTVHLTGGFLPDPHTTDLTAGGPVQVSRGSDCTYGRVANAPDLDLQYTAEGGRTLYIYARAAEDITLLVNLPDGSWICDDDSLGGLDPLLVIPKGASGLYDIWVGTYGEDTVPARLFISEVDPR